MILEDTEKREIGWKCQPGNNFLINWFLDMALVQSGGKHQLSCLGEESHVPSLGEDTDSGLPTAA
jgi:hypothetical protein